MCVLQCAAPRMTTVALALLLLTAVSPAAAAPVLHQPPAQQTLEEKAAPKPKYVEGCALPQMRPALGERSFTSPVVDDAIARLVPRFKDRDLATLFANALPNALDSTVIRGASANISGGYDTFIVTGDIDAMWQRDSTNQAKPYLRFLREQKAGDTSLTDFFRGLIARQAHNTLLDPYANAYQRGGDLAGGADSGGRQAKLPQGWRQGAESDAPR